MSTDDFSTKTNEIISDFKETKIFNSQEVCDTSLPPQSISLSVKREYYYSKEAPSKIVFSFSNKVLEQMEIFELNKKGQ
ncbi:MAG: hypothetical protein PHF97_09870 [Bacteroidales bacterium]|nr:hypothetical protein [Bacteroidales bacterium]